MKQAFLKKALAAKSGGWLLVEGQVYHRKRSSHQIERLALSGFLRKPIGNDVQLGAEAERRSNLGRVERRVVEAVYVFFWRCHVALTPWLQTSASS